MSPGLEQIYTKIIFPADVRNCDVNFHRSIIHQTLRMLFKHDFLFFLADIFFISFIINPTPKKITAKSNHQRRHILIDVKWNLRVSHPWNIEEANILPFLQSWINQFHFFFWKYFLCYLYNTNSPNVEKRKRKAKQNSITIFDTYIPLSLHAKKFEKQTSTRLKLDSSLLISTTMHFRF